MVSLYLKSSLKYPLIITKNTIFTVVGIEVVWVDKKTAKTPPFFFGSAKTLDVNGKLFFGRKYSTNFFLMEGL